MATLATMYAAQANSPGTETASALDATATSVLVQDASVLPAVPFLLTLGYDKNESETVVVTARNDNTLTIIRGVDGPASIWVIGTKCARILTAKDINDMQDNIQTLNSSKEEAGTAATAISTHDGDSSAHSTLLGGKADKVSGATNGNFAALDSNGNLIDSGHKDGDYLKSHQDITGKADKVSGATNGNLASLDSNGNLTDSGYKPGDFQPKMTAGTDYVAPSEKGAANGIPTLTADGLVTPSQMFAKIIAVSSSRNLAATDYGAVLSVTGSRTLTIPTGLAVGAEIEILNYGTGTVTIAAASGVTINGGTSSVTISDQYKSAVLKCMASNVWVIQGAIS